MSFSLETFQLHEMLRCGRDLRKGAQATATMEEAAQKVVRYLYDECRDAKGNRECVLVRFYKTHRFASLPDELKAFASNVLGEAEPAPEMRNLVLLASAGDKPEWNDRRASTGHQAVPLPSSQMVERAPMIAQLIREMGLEIESVIAPTPEFVSTSVGKTYNVFHVRNAVDSPYIPAQAEFVKPFGVRSVIGFGGLLFSGDLYAVILFAKCPIPLESATRFRTIALDLKVAITALEGDKTFAAVPLADAV